MTESLAALLALAIAATLNMALHYPQILQVLATESRCLGRCGDGIARWLSSLFRWGSLSMELSLVAHRGEGCVICAEPSVGHFSSQ